MTDYAQHLSALDRAVERAHKAHLKARSAAQGAVTNAKRQVQLNATARRTLTEWTELAEAASAVACALTELTALRLKTDPPELAGADHPFATGQYQSDNGPVVTFAVDADGRLALVPHLTAEQCAMALQIQGLQHVVRKAVERRQRVLAKGGA